MHIQVGHPLANRVDILDPKTRKKIPYVKALNTDEGTLTILEIEEGDTPTERRLVRDGSGGWATKQEKCDFVVIDKKNGKVVKDITEDGKGFIYDD